MLADGLESAGVHVRYRGQDISEAATSTGRQRFGERFDAQVATGDTLLHDAFDDFDADLVIVDPPWGLRWADYASDLEARQGNGSFVFGFPQPFDSTWLFISLALEKLRPAARDVVPTEQAGHARYALPQHGPESVSAIRDLDARGRDRFHYEREQALSVSAPQALANRIDQAANVRDLTVVSVVSEQAIKNSGDGYPVDVVVPRAIFPGLVRLYDAGDLRDVDQAPYRRVVVIHRLGLDHLDRKGSIGAAAGWPIRAVV